MLGTPNRGSFAIVEALLGRDRLVRMLATLDLRNSLNRIIALLAEYPGVMDLLPQDGELDLYDVATWRQLIGHNGRFGHVPEAERLKGARLRRERLPTEPAGRDLIVYVAGQAPLTPVGIRLGESGERLRFVGTTEGDGRVTHAAGALPGVRRWFCDAVHGDQPATRSAFPAYLDLLETGQTNQLPTEPLSRQRGPGGREFVYEPLTTGPQDEAALIAEALGASGDGDETTKQPALTVSLRHADLAQARYPVLCGHAAGDVISGAEAALDEALGGALSRRYQLDRIPAQVGSTALILAGGWQRWRVPGAVVMGLGELGELSAALIAEATYSACLDYLLTVPGPADGGPLGLSAVLVGGNSPAALHEADIIRAIVQGVVRANQSLAGRPDDGTGAGITELEILENDGSRFREACLFLDSDARQLGEALGTRLTLRRDDLSPPERGEGAQGVVRGVPPRWRRLIVTEQSRPPALNYELLGLRARIPGRAVDFEPATVARLLADAMRDPRFDPETANALYHLLIPNHLGDQIEHFDALMLIVDEQTARLPFEMLSNNRCPGTRPLAVRQAMVRQFRTAEFRQTLKPVRARSALVIGDPLTPLAELPGARKEAQAVASGLLGQGYDVRLLLQPDGAEVLRALFARPWRILHVAGHGIHEAAAEDPGALRNGILLDDGALLGRPQISELPETPDLVFLNCCHLGRIIQLSPEQRVRFQHFAGTIARSFISIGVRGLVVGGWEVNDSAAQRFAEVFYQALLSGLPMGKAVLRARTACWAQFPDYNTWGAYQCYGDPDLRLT